MKASAIPARRAEVIERLEPSDFADSYSSRPSVGVAVGLRNISSANESDALKQAADRANEVFPGADDHTGWIHEHNEELMAAVVGYSLCDPNDVLADPPTIPFAIEMARSALKSTTIARLYKRIELVRASASNVPEASTEEIEEFFGIINSGVLEQLDQSTAKRIRRLIYSALEQIRS